MSATKDRVLPSDIMRAGLLALAAQRDKSVLEIAAEERPNILGDIGPTGIKMLDATVNQMIAVGLITFPLIEAGIAARVEERHLPRRVVLEEAIEETQDTRTKLALQAMLAHEAV